MIPPFLLLLWFLTSGAVLSAAEVRSQSAASPILDPEKEGQQLAGRLRSSAPRENSHFTGVLEVTGRDGKMSSVPITSEIIVTSTNWQTLYRTAGGSSSETLAIVHTPGKSNSYSLAVGSQPALSFSLTAPFAQSDFWVLDLGLEFFHWPVQRAIRSEMSRSRPCRVLESTTPQPLPGGYGRVLSWIDLETGGVIQAEAYDLQNKLFKKFALGSFTKVAGQYQLRDMKIRNLRTQRQTELKFHLNAGNAPSP